MNHEAVEIQRRIVLAGRYTLVRPIATGGMAEIFLARQRTSGRGPAFAKDVVIKLLKDRFRGDRRVLAMFRNEARVGALFNHPNIVHVYDVGEHEGTPFIAMELIQGDELSQLCRRGLELGHFLPLEHAVDLMRQAAEAMGYFHAKRDEAGRGLGIVHRDVSPSNLLVTPEGVLKIIDFGIARAGWHEPDALAGAPALDPPGHHDGDGDGDGHAHAHADEDDDDDASDEKLVPGKYNYMSPEQIRGEHVDQRSDLFSLGIVLYEIAVGRRLFKGRPEEVIQRITRGKIPPPTVVRPRFPAALEAIVMRALETHPEDRYQSAYQLANDLEEVLRRLRLKSGSVRIARYLDDLRVAEGGERRPELVVAGEAWVDDDAEDAAAAEPAAAAVPEALPDPPPVAAPPAAAPVLRLLPLPPGPEEDEKTNVDDEDTALTDRVERVAMRGEVPDEQEVIELTHRKGASLSAMGPPRRRRERHRARRQQSFGQGVVERRRSFPWLPVIAAAAVLAVVVFLLSRA
jgi:serine/threonine protein kinase